MTSNEFSAAILLLGGEIWVQNTWCLLAHDGTDLVIWDSATHIGARIENSSTAAHFGVEVRKILPYDVLLERIVKYLEACNDKS